MLCWKAKKKTKKVLAVSPLLRGETVIKPQVKIPPSPCSPPLPAPRSVTVLIATERCGLIVWHRFPPVPCSHLRSVNALSTRHPSLTLPLILPINTPSWAPPMTHLRAPLITLSTTHINPLAIHAPSCSTSLPSLCATHSRTRGVGIPAAHLPPLIPATHRHNKSMW